MLRPFLQVSFLMEMTLFLYGTAKRRAVEPLYPYLPMALHEYPDKQFYALLAVVDSLRQNKVRDSAIAGELFVDLLRGNHANGTAPLR